jgi:hypothetical protein
MKAITIIRKLLHVFLTLEDRKIGFFFARKKTVKIKRIKFLIAFNYTGESTGRLTESFEKHLQIM